MAGATLFSSGADTIISEAPAPSSKRRAFEPEVIKDKDLSELSQDSKSHDILYHLPDGWKKRLVRRKSGVTAGIWDVYLHTPFGKRLRSSKELAKFLTEHPEVACDRRYVNMDRPSGMNFSHNKLTAVASAKSTKALKLSCDSSRIDCRSLRVPCDTLRCKGLRSPLGTLTAPSRDPSPTQSTPRVLISPTRAKQVSSRTLNSEHNDSSVKKMKQPQVLKKPNIMTVYPDLSSLTPEKILVLEKLFMDTVCIPTPSQISTWSKDLALDESVVCQWFKSKWKAKLVYEEEVAKRRIRAADLNDTELLSSRRKMRKFDLSSVVDAPILYPMGNEFVIEYNNCEEDTP